MGGCASRPRDLDHRVPAPVPIEKPKAEDEAVVQESNGGETNKEETLVGVAESAAQEAPEEETTCVESKPLEHPAESKDEDHKQEEAATAPTAAMANPKKKAEEAAAAPAITTKPNVAQKSDDKSDNLPWSYQLGS